MLTSVPALPGEQELPRRECDNRHILLLITMNSGKNPKVPRDGRVCLPLYALPQPKCDLRYVE
jgi:hypothetical protein